MGEPWLQDPDVTLYHGDALETLRQLPDRSVHMVATSPPFYGLRDYGTGEWEGGDADCDHMPPQPEEKIYDNGQGEGYASNNQNWNKRGRQYQGGECPNCGARRVDQQIGLEETPDQWVDRLVAVFRECRRVLRDDGSLWIEIGDSYNAHPGGGGDRGGRALNVLQGTGEQPQYQAGHGLGRTKTCKPKDLLGQPWLLAFALRADGWYLRSEIIWARPNPMPESVTDRPTKSHSTVFLLSKQPRYFYDADAIREAFSPGTIERSYTASRVNGSFWGAKAEANPDRNASRTPARVPFDRPVPQAETLDGSAGEAPRGPDGRRATAVQGQENSEQHRDGQRWPHPAGANARSVWMIPTESTPFAHFATWPQALVRRMILAGTSEKGCCPECGAPWVREVSRTLVAHQATNNAAPHVEGRSGATRGWSPSCAHEAPPIPSTILDPFAGSGTTCLVARNQGRHAIGIELNETYLKIAGRRLAQLSLLALESVGRDG